MGLARSKYTRNLAAIEAAEAKVRAAWPKRYARLTAPRPRARPVDTSAWSPAARRRYHGKLRAALARLQADQYLARDAVCNQPAAGAELEPAYALALKRAPRYQRECAVRKAIARKLYSFNAWLRVPLERWNDLADRLFRARTEGHWGVDRLTGELAVAFEVHSHCPLLDPAEARERQREVIDRLVVKLEALIASGRKVFYVVLSVPNVAAGDLAAGKRAIYRRYDQVVRGVTPDGKKKLPREQRPFPQIVGGFVTQEDPLGQDLRTWNVHLNALLVVDGALSFKRLRHDWGRRFGADCQVHIRQLEGGRRALIRACLEVVKYSMKAITKPQLGKALLAAAEPICGACDPPPTAPHFSLEGGPGGAWRAPRHGKRGHAPPFIAWPLERVGEWLAAQHGFRRIRTFGELYRLGPKPELPARDIRWLGRVAVGATYARFSRPPLLDSIQPDKSAWLGGWGLPNKPPLWRPRPLSGHPGP